jgi:NlpC/P60 family.
MICSAVYLTAGTLLPRDSWQHSDFLIDRRIEGDLSNPGDLHFFGKNGKISHVGISTGGYGIIPCLGSVKEEVFSHGEGINHNTVLKDMYMHTCSLKLNLKL